MDSHFRYCNYPGDPPTGIAAVTPPEKLPGSITSEEGSGESLLLPKVPVAPALDDLVVSVPIVDPPSLWRCTVCNKVFNDPVICKDCEDSFCSGCLERHCGDSEDCGGQLFDSVARNGHLRKLILGLRHRCPKAVVFDHDAQRWRVDAAGCPFIGTGTEVEAHQETCGYRFISCPHCQSIFEERNRSDHVAVCMIRCQLCADMVYYEDFVLHVQKKCPEAAGRCPNDTCAFRGRRRDLSLHVQTCGAISPRRIAPSSLVMDDASVGPSAGEKLLQLIDAGKAKLTGSTSGQASADTRKHFSKKAGVGVKPGASKTTPESPGTPHSDTGTPAAARAREWGTTNDPSKVFRNGSKTRTGEVGPEGTKDTFVDSKEREAPLRAAKTSSADQLAQRAESSLDDLLHHPHSWRSLEQSVGGKRGRPLLLALESLIKEKGPETLRAKLLETGAQVNTWSLDLHAATLRLIFLVLKGKSDVRAEKLTREFLLGEILDAFGLSVGKAGKSEPSSRVDSTKRPIVSEDDRPKKLLKEVYESPEQSLAKHPLLTHSSRQRQIARNKIIRRILERLLDAPCAQAFREPVKEGDAPGYSKVVSRPMSISAILGAIAGSDSYTVSSLQDDVELIRQNAHAYCKDAYPEVAAQADQLVDLFNAELDAEKGALARWEL